MRKHSARKWLHFILDLLPVIILPVFAIYEINHDHNTSIEVEVSENKVVDFNQNVKELNRTNWSNSNSVVSYNDNEITFTASAQYGRFTTPLSLNINDIYVVSFRGKSTTNANTLWFSTSSNLNGPIVSTLIYNPLMTSAYGLFQAYFTNSYETNYLDFIDMSSSDWKTYYITDVMCFNLTQMFGSGNEPTIEQFNSLYQDEYYSYTVSRLELYENYSTETLSNTDIGSQMMYALYKPVKDYFNFNNVFNFGDIYHWFEVNIFGGTAPMSFFIVWNIVLYQFVMDLVFLIYGLFMWFIDMCEKLMDKPLNSIK